ERDEIDTRQIEGLEVIHRVVAHGEQSFSANFRTEQVRVADNDARHVRIESLSFDSQLVAGEVDHSLVQFGDRVILELRLRQHEAAYSPRKREDLYRT